jgi:hypothetical protein
MPYLFDIEKLNAIYALVDMVVQFAYRTTFRRQEALCDGGLSALESAFFALKQCGCPINSNGTITLKKLFEFQVAVQMAIDDDRPVNIDNETIMAHESLKAQLNGWVECCRKWQEIAIKTEEKIEQIFSELEKHIKERYCVTETLANTTDNEAYYAGASDTYLRLGAYIAELKKKYEKGGEE